MMRPDSELKGVRAWYSEAEEGEQVQVIRIPVMMNEWADLVLMADEWMVWVTPWQHGQEPLGLFEMSKICAESITGDQREMHAG